MNSYTVAFIGAGKISEAWIERLITSNALSADKVMACDPSNERLDYLKLRYPGLKTTTDNADGARFGSVVLIATPPPETISTLTKIRPVLRRNAIVISLAAGVPLQKLSSAAAGTAVLRVMPNTPSMVGEGMNLVCYPADTPADVRKGVGSLLGVFGTSLEIEEGDMEACGALCSVGPTFLFPVMQSIIDAAMAAGLSESLARKAAAQVFVGTGKLVGGNERTVAELNGMIGLHTLREPETMKLITDAYNEALGKLKGLAAKMSAVA
jgi:pyrroline-5-carboxylate reductase